jgi:hypothetical protein
LLGHSTEQKKLHSLHINIVVCKRLPFCHPFLLSLISCRSLPSAMVITFLPSILVASALELGVPVTGFQHLLIRSILMADQLYY